MGEVKFGELKGVDRNGNKYFENTEYPFGQHRWIEYKVSFGCDLSIVYLYSSQTLLSFEGYI